MVVLNLKVEKFIILIVLAWLHPARSRDQSLTKQPKTYLPSQNLVYSNSVT